MLRASFSHWDWALGRRCSMLCLSVAGPFSSYDGAFEAVEVTRRWQSELNLDRWDHVPRYRGGDSCMELWSGVQGSHLSPPAAVAAEPP